MSEVLGFSPMIAQMHADHYAEELAQFLGSVIEPIAEGLIVDHFAYRAWNEQLYDTFTASIRCHAESPIIVHSMNGSDISIAVLCNPVRFGRFGQTRTIEIMEAKQGGAITDTSSRQQVTFDHVEMWGVPLDLMQQRLIRYGIDYEQHSNPNHRALLVNFGQGRELRITDRQLVNIAQQQLVEGRSKALNWV